MIFPMCQCHACIMFHQREKRKTSGLCGLPLCATKQVKKS